MKPISLSARRPIPVSGRTPQRAGLRASSALSQRPAARGATSLFSSLSLCISHHLFSIYRLMFLFSVCCSLSFVSVLVPVFLFSLSLFLWTFLKPPLSVPLRGTLLLDYMPCTVFISLICLPSCPASARFYMFWDVEILVFCTMVAVVEFHSFVIWWKLVY